MSQHVGLQHQVVMAWRGRTSLRSRSVLLVVGILAALLLTLIASNILAFHLRSNTMFRLDVGFWGDQDLLRGVYAQETDGNGSTYRWTEGASRFFVRDFAAVRFPILRLDISGLPPGAGDERLVAVEIDQAALAVPVRATERQYYLLPPSGALLDGDLDVAMISATSIEPPDGRELAFRLNDITLGWSAQPWSIPTLPMLLVQAAIVLAWVAVAWRLEVPRWVVPCVAMAAIALVAWMTSYRLMVAMAWQTRVLAISVIVLAVAWHGYDRLERWFPGWLDRRALQWLCWLTALSIAVRLFVILYPPFGSHDLYIHERRLADVQIGAVQLFDTPSEFGGKRTIVPPAFYVLLLPITLLTRDPSVAIHALYALCEATTPLLVGLLIHQLGGSHRAALIAGTLVAFLPIQFTILWWGFGPQVLSQWLLLLLLVLLTRPMTRGIAYLLTSGLVLTIALLTHNGMVILGGMLVAGYIAALLIRARDDRPYWLRWGGVLVASGVVSVALVYGEIIASQLTSVQSSVEAVRPSAEEEWARIGRVWSGLQSSFRPLGYIGTAISVVMLLYKARNRWLPALWIGSAVLFLIVDLALGLQVRYGYFLVPVVCGGAGIVLDWLSRQRVWGRIAAVAIVAYVALYGTQLWVSGVFWGIKPTLTALTH